MLDGANVPAGLTRKRRSRKKTKPKVEDEKTTNDELVKDEVDSDDETKQDVDNDEPLVTEKAEGNSNNDDEEDIKGFDPNNLDVDSLRAKFANLASFDQEK